MTADPETRTTQNGISVTSFNLAVGRIARDANGAKITDFLRCVAWRHTADYLAKYAHKGDKIAVEGEINTRQYEKDGATRTITEITVHNAEICKSAKAQQTEAPAQADAPQQQTFIEVDDDELPFECRVSLPESKRH